MKVFTDINHYINASESAVTIGTFDGVHHGHKSVLQKLKNVAAEKKIKSVIVTFFPHPRMILYPNDHGLKLLNTIEEKIALLEKENIDELIMMPFTPELSRLLPNEFVEKILIEKLKTKILIVGYDHRFGKHREGDIHTLESLKNIYDFELIEIPPHEFDHIKISSTKIRNALLDGQVNEANILLGRNYSITGTVAEGKKLGREIGFPTANISEIDSLKLIPKDGVYAVKIAVNEKKYNGMINIGFRPTVDGLHHIIEANIFDFSEDIYYKKIGVEFISRIRDEIKFSNIEALKNQLVHDKQTALRLLA